MTRLTPTERTVLFPEPLREQRRSHRVVAFLCLAGALGSAGWYLLRDPAVQRWSRARVAPIAPRVAGKLASVFNPAPVPAPRAGAVDSGVDAYGDEAYDTSAVLLRRALRARGADSLDLEQRVRALTFLGAAELLGGQRDSAAAAFRQLLVLDPRRPPDPDVFPETVTGFYDGVRSSQQGVARIASTSEGVALTLVALKPHEVSIGIGQNGQPPTFQLFRGVVRDSVVVTWDGVTPAGAALRPGTYEVVLVVYPKEGGRRSVRFPVVLERERVTGALHARAPGAPTLPPEHSDGAAGQLLR